MKKHIYDRRGINLLLVEDDTPICGEDFCETCGDCLSCYGGEPCLDDGQHYWVQYGHYPKKEEEQNGGTTYDSV